MVLLSKRLDDIVTKVLEFSPDLENKDIKNKPKDMYNEYNRVGKIIYNPKSIMNTLGNFFKMEMINFGITDGSWLCEDCRKYCKKLKNCF